MKQKKTLIYIVFIAGIFFCSNSAFISQIYILKNYFSNTYIEVISMRYNYIVQIIGLLVYSLMLKKFPKLIQRKEIYVASLSISSIAITTMVLFPNSKIVIISGLFLNFLCISGFALALIATNIPQNEQAQTIALGYSLGTISTFLLSIIIGDEKLSSPDIVAIYIIVFFCLILLVCKLPQIDIPKENAEGTFFKARNFDKKTIILMLVMLFLMSLLSSYGTTLTINAVINDKVHFEYTKLYYAAGLILAGMIADKNRRQIAICCLVSCSFPFVAIAFFNEETLYILAAALNYAALGFFTIFIITLFLDIASKDNAYIWLTPFGIIISQLGGIIFSFFNKYVIKSYVIGPFLVAMIYIPLVFCFIFVFNKLYSNPIKAPFNLEQRFRELTEEYTLTKRELEVLMQLYEGCSNPEISANLFISEPTVKFHVGNILKKTNCKNRIEVVSLIKLTS